MVQLCILMTKRGQNQFYKSYATTLGTTILLKYTVREKRPDSNARDSFPQDIHHVHLVGLLLFIKDMALNMLSYLIY